MTQTLTSLAKPRRFYSGVNVAAAETGFAVQLDGRTPRSPARRPLVLPTYALARLIADEFAAQGASIDYAAMAATRLAHSALDAVPGARLAVAAEVARCAGADLICYFAEGPSSLVARQQAAWGPWLDWARSDLGLDFERASGVVHRPQPPATLARVAALAAAFDDFSLAGLSMATGLFGSAILALALARGEIGAEAALSTSRIDETFQAERWGEDAEAAQRAAVIAAEAEMLQAWFGALKSP